MSVRIQGRCNAPGPWGTVCTDYPGHAYSHYDASDDSSWQDDWRENTSVLGGGMQITDHGFQPWEGEVGDPPTCDVCGFAAADHASQGYRPEGDR